MSKRVLIVAGGTGGHIFPALAVAHCLRAHQVTPYWLGSTHGMEGTIVPAQHIELIRIAISGIRGKGFLRWLLAPFSILRATWAAMVAILRIRPGVVLGMGGFVSGPGGLAAWLCRTPLVIHEQNAIPGLTNRIMRHFARRVLVAYPGTFPADPKIAVTGNPLRTEISNLVPAIERAPRERRWRILVLGGSLGARTLNREVPAGLARFAPAAGLEIHHQTGPRDLDATRATYANLGLQAHVEPFITDMAAEYAWADVVICRAGALTIAEVSAAGIPAVLVPFPFAVDDHQTANATYLVERGAALMLRDDTLDAESLAQALHRITDDPTRLQEMATRARAAAYLSATDDVARECMELLHDQA